MENFRYCIGLSFLGGEKSYEIIEELEKDIINDYKLRNKIYS